MSKLRKALKKAKEDRGLEDDNILHDSSRSDRSKPENPQKATLNKGVRPELQINYSETKVKKIDDHILKKGKVISLFHETDKIDQIKTLRTQVVSKLAEVKGNTLLITSANPYEGKTFTAINLGVSIAQELDRAVLIIDADLRKHNGRHANFALDFFGTDMDEGLSNYLLGQAQIPEILFNPGINRLVLLPAGRPLANSAELLGSPRMVKLVNDVKSRYKGDRIIIFDCASLLSCADPLVLSRYVDGILFVIEENRTTIDEVQRAMELLKDKPVFGTLLNKSTTKAN